MAQAVTDFLKYAGFLDLLNRLTAVTFVVVGLVSFFSRRMSRMNNLPTLAIVPLLVGLLTMSVDRYTLENGPFMYGRPSAAAIVAGRRDALINAIIGALGGLVFAATVILSRKRASRHEV